LKLKKAIGFLIVKSIGQYINFLSYVLPQKAVALAYTFFSNPQKGKIDSRKGVPKVLQNTISETTQYNQHQFQTYIWPGNETKILLLHGWESNSSRWKKTLPYLQKSGSTIIALDAPAHGQSSGKEFNVPLYVEFIKIVVERHQPSIVIGHSIGGFAIIYHQYLFPESSIQKMVLLGAPCDLRLLFDSFAKQLSLNKKMYLLLEKRTLDYFNFKVDDFSAQKFVSKINCKALIAHDELDKIIPFEQGKKIANSWQQSFFIPTQGHGHALHDEELYLKMSAFLFDSE
jgi:pimeloyl-ACP methyl ester carboxylesterase